MKRSLFTWSLLVAALCSLPLLSACTGNGGANSTGDNQFHQSGGTPVNPNTDPGGQGVPGSRSTGANNRQTPGRP